MYELIRAGENTWYMACPTNIGIVRLPEDRALLIDSGLDKDTAKKALRHAEDLGLTVTAVVCTHSHSDHIGGAAFLRQRTGCAVYAPEAELSFLRQTELEPAFLFGGYPPDPLRNKFLLARPCPDVLPLTEEVLPPGFSLKLIGGHTFSMALLRTPDGVWFVGDALASPATLRKYPVSFLYDVEGFLSGLDALEALEGTCFVPAHAEGCSDLAPLIQVNRENTLALIGRIRDLCREKRTMEELLKALFDSLGHTLNWNQYVLVGCTLRCYLAYLLNRGELVTSIEDNRLLWHTPDGE